MDRINSLNKVLLLVFVPAVKCTTFVKGLENEFKSHVGVTNDTLPNDPNDSNDYYEGQLSKFTEFEMHAFAKITGFLVFGSQKVSGFFSHVKKTLDDEL